MRKIAHHILFVAALASLVACSQANQESKQMPSDVGSVEEMAPMNQPLDQSLVLDSLSTDQLQAMEELATQKVRDLAGFFQLAADPKADPAFRQQAAELARELLVEGATIQLKDQVLADDSLTDALLADGTTVADWALTNVQLNNSFHVQGEGMYVSDVSFQQGATAQSRKAILRLEKRKKQFGSTTKTLWEVRIERIE